MPNGGKTLGKRVDLIFEGCKQGAFESSYLDKVLRQACDLANAHIVKTSEHIFPTPNVTHEGLTKVFILSESDLTVHTYPREEEGRLIVLSMFTCGETADPEAPIEYLKDALGAEKTYRLPLTHFNSGHETWTPA